MALAATNASTYRSCTATLDAASQWTPAVYLHGNMEMDIIIDGSTNSFSGTLKLQRSRSGGDAFTTKDYVTDVNGTDYSWTGDATPVIQMAVPAYYRLEVSAFTSGSALVELRAGNRD